MLIEKRPRFGEHLLNKGRREGEALLLKRQLARRFGTLSKATATRVESAISAQLEAWSLNILDAHTLEDVFRTDAL